MERQLNENGADTQEEEEPVTQAATAKPLRQRRRRRDSTGTRATVTSNVDLDSTANAVNSNTIDPLPTAAPLVNLPQEMEFEDESDSEDAAGLSKNFAFILLNSQFEMFFFVH